MFGLGKKDSDGRQVRLEHRGKNLRASRTGGVAARVQTKVSGVNVTANTAKGLRISARIANGLRIAGQNGKGQIIGRWQKGPLRANFSNSSSSKASGSISYKNKMGTLNLTNPNRSSAKFAGVQVRGKKAAQAHALYLWYKLFSLMVHVFFILPIKICWFVVKMFFPLVKFLLSISIGLILFVPLTILGFVRGFFSSPPRVNESR